MNRSKIQPRLANEIVKIKEGKRPRLGLRLVQVEAEEKRNKITVNIVHNEKLEVDSKEITKKDPIKILSQLDSKFEEVQAPVKDKLQNINGGVDEPKKSLLSNSIVIDLTPSQIESMSEVKEAKVITLEALDR